MARIIIYQNDDTPNLGDKWIGTDRGTGGTRNFTASGIADLFNNTSSIGVAGQNNFRFVTDQGIGRITGSISFEELAGDNTLFNDVTELIISKTSLKNVYISDYIKSLPGNYIIITDVNDHNSFGIYKVSSAQDALNEPNYIKLVLLSEDGNGSLNSLKTYSVSVYAYQAEILDKFHQHTQDIASDTWNVTHNLSKYPSVTVTLSTGQVGIADVSYIDENNLTITFAGDESGKAYMN